MNRKLTFRSLVIPVALLALLLFAMTLGTVVHNHAGSSEANCSICHLSHQSIDQPLVANHGPSLAQVDVRNEAEVPAFPPTPAAPRLPARAPPAV